MFIFFYFLFSSTQNQSSITGMEQKNVLSHLLASSTHQSISSPPSESQLFVVDSPQEPQDQHLLLPPSAFMTTGFEHMVTISCSTWTDISMYRVQVMWLKQTFIMLFVSKLGKLSSSGSGRVPLLHQVVAARFPGGASLFFCLELFQFNYINYHS